MRVAGRRWTHVVAAIAIFFAGSLVATVSAIPAQNTKPDSTAAASQDAKSQVAGTSAGTVWAGVYTEEQAKRGEAVSNKLCTSCHGPNLSGGEAGPTLVGLEFLGNWTTLSIADFFDRVHSTMPADAPGTLTPQQTSDVTAYVLKLNKYPAGQTELPTDLAALKTIKIEGQPAAK